MWTELVDAATVDAAIWPRAAAVAERLWVGPPGVMRDRRERIPNSTEARLARFRCRLLERGIGASPLDGVGRTGLQGPSSCLGTRETPLQAALRPPPVEKPRSQRRESSGPRRKRHAPAEPDDDDDDEL
eukprot:gnl/TRDRNA2_/TRDRNA2_158336_c2_seq1.p2 gnl/TRDRNA2_/TRDRNA2_158336_c2~~gnl/TRDRNA2_/TRDRNA2_158336_c2_seq1.p2  ORF type:complete len:143 (+),score=24.91 gnl/TRDRNA2_/TRDRNA2_158336_c2_seq1:44-430(+)